MTDALLQRIEGFYDLVPRASAHTEQLGPFTLFVADYGWPFYARPRIGARDAATTTDVLAVLERQKELGIPQAFEWLGDLAPDLAEPVRAAGLGIHHCPLMVLDGDPSPPATHPDVDIRIVGPDELDLLTATRAAVDLGFRAGGVDVGPDPVTDGETADQRTTADRIRNGLLVQVAAIDRSTGQVLGGGAHVPRAAVGVTELVGIGVRPSARHRGVGLGIAAALAVDARSAGVDTVFLSADSDDVARIYARTGFVRRGTSCIAEPPD
jgi:ribosomal protein S18 acetylase RimI-like enzyme